MSRGWSKALRGAVLLLATLSVVSASSQIGFGSLVQRRILADLKQAQEAAGIYVDDSHLFQNPVEIRGRRLQQTVDDVSATLSNPAITAAILGLMANGSTVGGFPGISLNLPGGSGAGYAPTDDSYCLFSTAPRNSSTGNAATISGLPGGLPSSFTCVEGSTAGPNGFVVSYNSTTYSCTNSAGPGRKLLQTGSAVSPALANLSSEAALNGVFENILNAVGLPVWNCLIATTPAGNTTFGQATLAVLNDLGVVAQHFLTYLNAEDGLTYAQDVQNDFVSLTNPLYPTGPRFNFSIDFETVAKDRALFREIFGFPAPPSPPPPAPVAANTDSPATATTGGTVPSGSTPSNTAQTQASSQTQATQSQSTQSTQAQSSGSGVTSQATSGQTPIPAATTAPATPDSSAQATMTVFDGYLSNCQIVIGSIPGGDGNFNRNNDFQAVVIDGQTSLSMNATQLYNGSASYVIPAAKNVEYAALTQATRSTAQYCYDLATLQPVYNPIASIITANSAGMAGNALTTLAVFGQSYGTTPQSVVQALGVNIPQNATLFTYNALGEAINGSSQALAFLKANTALTNLVTAGATLLTNDSSSYASFAIIMDQAVARKISFSPPLTSQGRKLLQTGAPAVDLTNATTVSSIMQIAQQIAQSSADNTVRGAVTADLNQQEIDAVAASVAALNSQTYSSNNVAATQLSQLYGQSNLASAVSSLARGDISTTDFANQTSSDGISTALSSTLPGTLLPTPTLATAPSPAEIAVTRTQAATTSTSSNSSSGLSHGGKVALAVVFPIVGVIAIVAGIAFFLSRRNRSEPASGTVWYRRPFARGQTAQSAV